MTLNPLLSPTVHRLKLLSQLHPIPPLFIRVNGSAASLRDVHRQYDLSSFEVTARYKSSNYYTLKNCRLDSILGRKVLPGNATAQV